MTLTIYDAVGRKVICLVDGVKAAGWHTAEWDGVDGKGTLAASGIYFYRLRAGGESVEVIRLTSSNNSWALWMLAIALVTLSALLLRMARSISGSFLTSEFK